MSLTYTEIVTDVASFDFETKHQGSDWGTGSFHQKDIFSGDIYHQGKHYTLPACFTNKEAKTWLKHFNRINKLPDVLWVGHNIWQYDIPALKAFAADHSVTLTSILACDTLKSANRASGWGSKSLGSLAWAYQIQQKGSIPNYVWEAAYAGDSKACAMVDDYCRNDTEVSVKLYLAMRAAVHLKLPYGKLL